MVCFNDYISLYILYIQVKVPENSSSNCIFVTNGIGCFFRIQSISPKWQTVLQIFFQHNYTLHLKGIYMKYFIFITTIMLLLTACTQQSESDNTVVTDYSPDILLDFKPFEFEITEAPDLSGWQRMPDANYDNLLGYPVRIEKYRCDLPGEMYGTYYTHGIHNETKASLFSMLRQVSCYDADSDGCYVQIATLPGQQGRNSRSADAIISGQSKT